MYCAIIGALIYAAAREPHESFFKNLCAEKVVSNSTHRRRHRRTEPEGYGHEQADNDAKGNYPVRFAGPARVTHQPTNRRKIDRETHVYSSLPNAPMATDAELYDWMIQPDHTRVPLGSRSTSALAEMIDSMRV